MNRLSKKSAKRLELMLARMKKVEASTQERYGDPVQGSSRYSDKLDIAAIEEVIRQAAAQPAEVCEWRSFHTQDWYKTSCSGDSFQLRMLMKFCPCCGKPIKIKGE